MQLKSPSVNPIKKIPHRHECILDSSSLNFIPYVVLHCVKLTLKLIITDTRFIHLVKFLSSTNVLYNVAALLWTNLHHADMLALCTKPIGN